MTQSAAEPLKRATGSAAAVTVRYRSIAGRGASGAIENMSGLDYEMQFACWDSNCWSYQRIQNVLSRRSSVGEKAQLFGWVSPGTSLDKSKRSSVGQRTNSNWQLCRSVPRDRGQCVGIQSARAFTINTRSSQQEPRFGG